MAPVTRLGRGSDSCARCNQLGRACASCTQRRRATGRAARPDDRAGGRDAEHAARPDPCARRSGADRRELEKYRLDSIPVTRARDFLASGLAREPGLTRLEVAHRMGIHQADFDRAFGYAPAKHGAMQTRVGIATASCPVRAPYELDGC